MPSRWDLEHAKCIPHGEGFPEYDIKLHQEMRPKFWRFGECGVSLHCHYSKVHTDPEWYYLLGSHLWVKKICLQIIYIQKEYFIPYNREKIKKLRKNVNINVQCTRFPKIKA